MNVATLTTVVLSVGVPVAIAVIIAAANLVLTRMNDTVNRRRDRYASAMTTLVAWIEFPYRVRRRVNDDPATLEVLVTRGHDLQEKMAGDRSWIATENRTVSALYADASNRLAAVIGEAVKEAWRYPAITQPQNMVLGDWGPGRECAAYITSLEVGIARTFGWQRLRVLKNRNAPSIKDECQPQ